MELAEKLCDNILLMNKGNEVKSGKLSEIKRKFGGNNVRLEFSGDDNLINQMPEVLKFESYNNYSEIHLKDEVSPSKFLKQIIQKVDVKHFSVIEPTLNKIFIDLINENT
jgi:ABC-2 type transport system ATP-binding protein